MQEIKLFSGLPTSLSCNILRNWLTLKSVMALDSAFCCHSCRSDFLYLLQSDEYFIRDTIRIGSEVSVSVLWMFGQKLRSVAIEHRLSPDEVNFVAALCQNLTHMHIQNLKCCTSELWILLHENLQLESVSLSTKRIHYCGPPSTFLSFADIQSPSFRLIDERNYDNILDDHWREVLSMSRNVIRLDFYRTNVSHATLLQLPQLCPHITSIGLKSTNLTSAVLRKIISGCFYIVDLDISDNLSVNEAAILPAVRKLNGLQSLSIRNVPNVTCATIKHLYRHCVDTLHTLFVTCSDNKLPEAMGKLLQRCTHLRTLSIGTNHNNVSDLNSMFLPCTLSRLTTLIFDGFDFDDYEYEYIVSIGRYGVNLEVLSLYDVSCITSRSFLSLYNGCPKLKKLYIDVVEKEGFIEEPQVVEFVEFAQALWQQLRPGLEIIDMICDTMC